MKRYCVGLIVGFVLLSGIGIGNSDAVEHPYSIASDSARISFHQNEKGLALDQVEFLQENFQRKWIAEKEGVPLWSITILDTEKKQHTVTALNATAALCSVLDDPLRMEWKGIQPGNLQVLATVEKKNEVFEWSLEFEVKEPGFTLWDAVYPEIGPLQVSEAIHGIVPYGWGLVHGDLENWRSGGVYPSASMAMPFVGVSDGQSGIYLGAHDPAGHPFTLFVGKRWEGKAASLGIRHDVEGMGKTTHYRLPYTITTTLFPGDWYECAQIYREAALQTEWGKIPSLSDRNDIPPWMKDTDLWYIGACHDEATANQVIAFATYFEVPTSAHIYQWHEIPFDDHYPEYFPAKPGFQKAVEKVQQAGIAVMPYINGRLWDSSTDSWRDRHAEEACSIDEKGEKYIEIYGSKVPLSPMCPFTELWKNTVTHLVDRLLNECKVKAVYIDQISAAAAKRCFAENHGHPIGGGTYWIQGYRDLIRRCQKVMPPDTALTTEENADPWNDLLQAWLLVNTPEKAGELVPIYPAVYGGRAISFGFQYIHGDDFTYKYPFRLKMARAFVFGSQLGWVGSQVFEASNLGEAECLKNLCLARHASRDALQFGTLLAPVGLSDFGTVKWIDGENQSNEQPAVLASVWSTPKQIRKIVLANVADEERKGTLTLDKRHGGSSAAASIQLVSEDGKIRVALNRQTDDKWQGTVSIPARGAVVYVLE